jgi:lipopolysaccharide heptosyltransferase II
MYTINRNIISESIKKILVIKLRGIGDVVCSSIVIDNLIENFPNAKIDYLVEKPSSFGLIGLRELNEVLVFDRSSIKSRFILALKIRRSKYDIVFDFFGNPSSAQITLFSAAKYRIGFPFRARKYAYNILGPSERTEWHNAELHLKVLEYCGLSTNRRKLKYFLSEECKIFSTEYFKKIFSDKNFVVGICPTGSWESKKCDPEKIVEIAQLVIQKYGAKILVLWGKGDEKDTFKIQSLLGSKSVIAPETSIQEMAALISCCHFLIANDSGPMHIATALEVPVLCIHGPTNPKLQGPYGEKHEWINLPDLDCIECNLLKCPRNHECFLQLPNEKIMNKIDSLIEKNNLKVFIHNQSN